MAEGKSLREVSPLVRSAARELRREGTAAEERLWEALRGRRLEGVKFRRQHAVGPFVLDFFSAEYGLVIELDGGVHESESQRVRDVARTEALEAQGYRLLRFRNDEVMNALPAVLDRIRTTLQNQSPLSRLRERGLGGEGVLRSRTDAPRSAGEES